MARCIGIDFDNTIVDYDDVFVTAAHHLQLLPPNFRGTKAQVRDTIRALPDGNITWTRLQAQVYGRDIERAVPFPGFRDFLMKAAAAGHNVYIISHKTRYAAADQAVDLHHAAFGWLRAQGFTAPDGPLKPQSIFFERERAAKIARIGACGCTDFIDDLIDILDDPAFPPHVRRFHFLNSIDGAAAPASSWRTIGNAIFSI